MFSLVFIKLTHIKDMDKNHVCGLFSVFKVLS